MSVEELLNKIEDLLESGKPAIMGTGKIRVDSDEIRKLLSDLRLQMPEEVKTARAIAAERKEILDSAQTIATSKINQASLQAKHMVDEHEITKLAQANAVQITNEAKEQAADIIAQAKGNAEDIINNAQKWATDLRASAAGFVENIMNESDGILTKGLEELSATLSKVRTVRKELDNTSLSKTANMQ